MSDRPAVRVRAMILSTPWNMTPEMVQTMLAIADRENLTPEAVAEQLGRPLDNTRETTIRDGVAIIPVHGPIARHLDLFTEISGGVSIETLALDLRTALDSPGAHSVLLDIDSPGGEAAGNNEFAAMVRAASAQKPVVAYIGGLGASAAYFIACAAGEVVVDAGALVGNIGTVMAVPDPDKRQSRSIDFVSSQSPHKRPDPRTEGGKSRLQALVDSVADVFIGAVAEYRGLDREAVEAIGGAILVGQQAVDAGLADRLGSFEGVVAQLSERAREPRRMGPAGRIAAQTTGGIMAQQEPTRMQRFMAWLGGEGEDTPFAGPPPAPAPAIAPNAGIPVVPQQPDPQVVALQAEITRLQAAEATRARESIAADATAFAEAEIVAGRALPAEHDALVGMYTDAATDDVDHPREGQPTRVARLTERQTARPAHALTRQLVPVRAGAEGGLVALDNPQATRQEGDDPAWTPERWRDLRAHTPTGKAILAQLGIPSEGVLTQAQREVIAARAGVKLTA
jgi:ClpP class serine protease